MSNRAIDSTAVYIPQFHLISREKKIKITKTSTVGRNGADVIVDDDMSSSLHCRFIISGINLCLIDLGSKNGTFVNGEKISSEKEVRLKYGDEIRIGSFQYKLMEEDKKLSLVEAVMDDEPQFTLANLASFFEASLTWKFVYLSSLVMLLFLSILILKISEIPSDLIFFKARFLNAKLASISEIMLAAALMCSTHAYLTRYYLRKSRFLKMMAFGLVSFFQIVTFFLLLIFEMGNLISLPEYINTRESLLRGNIWKSTFKSYHSSHRDLVKISSSSEAEFLNKDYERVTLIMKENSKAYSAQLQEGFPKE